MKLSPEEALAAIKEAAAEGEVRFASDHLTAQYNEEIQRIFRVLYLALRGKEPKRGIWVADGFDIGVVLNWDGNGYSSVSLDACAKVSEELGIRVSPDTIWENAAAELRSKEGRRPKD